MLGVQVFFASISAASAAFLAANESHTSFDLNSPESTGHCLVSVQALSVSDFNKHRYVVMIFPLGSNQVPSWQESPTVNVPPAPSHVALSVESPSEHVPTSEQSDSATHVKPASTLAPYAPQISFDSYVL